MTVERIFDELGHFKRFQACVYFAATFQAMACGIHYLASVFLVETPNFVCGVPGNITEVLYGNLTGYNVEDFLPVFKAGTGPLVVRTHHGEQWELGRCQRALRVDPRDFTYNFDGNKTVEVCDGNFAYDHSEVYQSIVTDWDLVCDRAWLAKLCQPTFMLGVLVGALVFGDIADRVGRVKILMFTSFCQFALGVCVAFSKNYYYFVALRFLLAMASSGYLVVVFVYVTEFTGIKVRTWTSMHVHAAFAVGIMVVALTGYLVREWWIYQIILSLCTSPFLLFCWKFPETPFYLIAKGRHKEAQTLLDHMARVNGLELRLKVEELLESEQNGKALLEKEAAEVQPAEAEKKLSILDLFGSWRMAGRTCTVWAIWFIGSLGYYVFSLGSVNLGGNQYINLFLAGAVELPSYLVGCFAMDRIGRKKTCAPALLLAGTACVLIIVVPADIEALAIALCMIGKFAIAIAFGLIYLYTCELYPTIIRSLAVGSGSMMCRVGSVVAPFCVYLADVWIYLPQLIVGILAFIIGILTMLLPETLGRPLTTTLEEAEALGHSPGKKRSTLGGKDAEDGVELKQHV
uniref:solute carrier family 22 member 16 n=1 Tax=Doryrhamphus excisus TaxID=161450 RepID=UPI0025ADCC71|nr:solute carrier family 22 member 16 [Doryrhamphus excisus]XP_057913360.1 solute carrier family 22 member 16 [Doryrhamphus excisus]XP_057913361.1 solute carrier family 22 member 16 [Doryrhamphus excisus]XP_057913362.1 solute carrier family 22 member 16 [Doryrhamphus excisus]